MMKFIYNIFTLVAFSALWFTFSGNSSGAGGGGGMTLTGAPFDGGTCANCHIGGTYGTVTPAIAVLETGTSTLVNNYVGGRTYDVRLLISAASGTPQRYGFQLVAANTSGLQAGSWSNFPSGTTGTSINNRTYVEHTTPQSTNNFTFRWTAPAVNFGTVTFYAVGNCVNNNGQTGGDRVGTSSLALPAQSCTLGTPNTTVTNVSCPNGSNGSVNLTISGGTTPYTFAWSNGATTQNLTNLVAGMYIVTVTDATNCQTTASVTVSANAAPTATITPSGATTFCTGDSVLLSASGDGTYAWSNSENTASITVKTAGSYTVTVTNNAGCTATASRTITVNPNPVVTATATASGTGSTGTASASATGGTAPYTYTWTGARTGASLTGLAAGTYTVTATDVNGCKSTKSVIVENHTGLESMKDILLFEARPTLSDGHFALHLDLKSEQNVRLETYNMMGQMVENQMIRGKNIVESMDWSHLSAGKYKLKLHTAEGIATCWIVIAK